MQNISQGEESSHIFAEVVGFNQNKVLLMPYSDIEGVGPGSIVDNTETSLLSMLVKVLSEELLTQLVHQSTEKVIFTQPKAFQ